MHVDPAWVAAGLMFVVSGGGWVITAFRNGKSQATRFGNLEGKVTGLSTRINSMETSVNNLSGRIDNLVNGFDGRGKRKK